MSNSPSSKPEIQSSSEIIQKIENLREILSARGKEKIANVCEIAKSVYGKGHEADLILLGYLNVIFNQLTAVSQKSGRNAHKIAIEEEDDLMIQISGSLAGIVQMSDRGPKAYRKLITDLVPSEGAQNREPPKVVITEPGTDKAENGVALAPGEITDIYFDLDNTLWDWVAMHAPGIAAMADLLTRCLQVPRDQVLKSMAHVYKKFSTLDFDEMIQHNPLVIRHILNISRGYKDPEAGIVHAAMEMLQLVLATYEEYNHAGKRKLELYPNVLVGLKALKDSGIKLHALTAAPKNKAVGRMKRMGIEPFFSTIMAADESMLRAKYKGKDGDYERIEEILASVMSNVSSHQADERNRRGHNSTTMEVVPLMDQLKPLDLATVTRKTRDQLKHCLVVGDSPKSDMGTAALSGSYGVFAEYGSPKPEDLKNLISVGNPKGVDRNINSEDAEILSIRKSLGNRMFSIKEFIELLDILSIPRPVLDK
jgi:phosphoglycolate phosphatase-like HAD superfamily hydrolase